MKTFNSITEAYEYEIKRQEGIILQLQLHIAKDKDTEEYITERLEHLCQ